MARILVIFPLFLLILSVPVFIGVYVWKDACRRNMNAALWTLIAVLAPSFIGFIIYLLVRSDHSDLRCASCGAAVTEEYAVCPNCGRALRAVCPDCGAPTQPGWRLCPYCSSPLSGSHMDVTPPVRPEDRTLWKILAAVIIIPIFIVMLVPVLFYTTAGSGSTDLSSMPVEDYLSMKNDPRAEEWIGSVRGDRTTVHALRYVSGSRTQYLVYVPGVISDSSLTGLDAGLFGGPRFSMSMESGQGIDVDTVHLLSYRGDGEAGLRVELDGKRLDCEITDADFDPALWVMGEED